MSTGEYIDVLNAEVQRLNERVAELERDLEHQRSITRRLGTTASEYRKRIDTAFAALEGKF